MFKLYEITGDVKQHRYETARVFDRFLELDRRTDSAHTEELNRWERELADAAGARVDNKTVYEITQNGQTVYVWFVDFKVYFGWRIELGGYWPPPHRQACLMRRRTDPVLH